MNDYFEHIIDCIVECDLNHTTLSDNSAATICLENYPKCFDDPFDSIINLNLKRELSSIQKWIFQHIGEIVYYNIPPKGMPVYIPPYETHLHSHLEPA